MVATHLTKGLEHEALGDDSRHWHGGPYYAGKMGFCPGYEGATRVAHPTGVTEDGTKCSVRLHRRGGARESELPQAEEMKIGGVGAEKASVDSGLEMMPKDWVVG